MSNSRFFFELGFPKIHLSQSSDGVEKKTGYLGSSTHRILSIPLLFMILQPIFPSPEAKIMLRENLVSAKRLTRFDKIALKGRRQPLSHKESYTNPFWESGRRTVSSVTVPLRVLFCNHNKKTQPILEKNTTRCQKTQPPS